MGDIITAFANIGTIYLEDERRVRNKAYEYQTIKTYLLDIESKTIEPSVNIARDDLIITRFGVGANSGNLFPNVPFEPKNLQKDFPKFVRGILKANKNFLSFFDEDQIKKNEILQKVAKIDDAFFDELKEEIMVLPKYAKEKGTRGKVATYFSLSFHQKPLSAYFKDIYEKFLTKEETSPLYGYDILTNKKGVGGDPHLAFCSVNELPTKMKGVKYRLLPLSEESAKKIKIGFNVMDKNLSHNFYGLKMAMLPILLQDDEKLYRDILSIMERTVKGEIKEIEESEIFIDEMLEEVAHQEKNLPVLNTILFYQKSNAAVDVLLQIDDLLPSYISRVSRTMAKYNIKAFKSDAGGEESIYLQNIFEERLDIMNLLLSTQKIESDLLVEKFSQLLYWGNINKKYAYPLDWGKYFNGYYAGRSIDAIVRYVGLFKELDKIRGDLKMEKEPVMGEETKENIIETLLQENEFLDNDVLKTAYLLGMLAAALSNWQYAVSQNDSFNRWLNNFGAITKERLDRLWKKEEETVRKLTSVSGHGNRAANRIQEMLIEYAPKAFKESGVVKSSYVSLAFAMGGSDFGKYIKEER
ncbi:TM1802 family CRISPR-associated protein [Nitratifractor salsuginis]|uniref:CRISPR-associated protein TM1802 n=1 Tax=Nitratifractor salsuginis (strain DSM 16511 / JCM 12458 / E9I37-1) TaxID=749222 RepID=E6WXP9_NITSE|nr:TM1802 family CRISPR-associated protein [Nitratifractor salsuginis]ADV46306.1 CRISPR-associated protein TM1802 [Nitratifractor salsuginis DSM 16511]